MKYAIVYSSRTGNTKLLADRLKSILNAEDCVYFGELSKEALAADLIYVGFWTDKGRADDACLNFIQEIKDKKIFLFGTCGFGKDASYFDRIINTTLKSVDSSSEVIGSYVCQGKMPMTVRNKYVEMKNRAFHAPNIDQLIDNFDMALTHPDNADLLALENKVQAILK